MEVAAPNSVDYTNQLPLGIESKSQRKLFFPTTGGSYSGDGTNICRIDLSYDGLIDTSQSYLMFEVKNNTADGYQLDLGQPLINRLRIECGGVVLEDIQNYNTLLAGVLVPAQNGIGNSHMDSFNRTQPSCSIINPTGDDDSINANRSLFNPVCSTAQGHIARVATNATASDETGAGIEAGNAIIKNGQSVNQCYKLVSGLLDNDKYLPLVLLNSPLTIEITFETKANAGTGKTGVGLGAGNLDISGLRYVAHTIDLERSFYDRLRMVQQNSGGVLQIAGTSFRNYSTTLQASDSQSLAIPARLRSIKSIFWKCCGSNDKDHYGLSAGGHANITEYQVKIGGNIYPPTAIKVNHVTNKIEPYLELQKAFGKLGSTVHSDLLSQSSYLVDANGITAYSKNTATAGNTEHLTAFAPYGIDMESFRHEIENGVDTSSKALPMTLEFKQSGTAGAIACQVFIMYDSIFYINMDGTISVST